METKISQASVISFCWGGLGFWFGPYIYSLVFGTFIAQYLFVCFLILCPLVLCFFCVGLAMHLTDRLFGGDQSKWSAVLGLLVFIGLNVRWGWASDWGWIRTAFSWLSSESDRLYRLEVFGADHLVLAGISGLICFGVCVIGCCINFRKIHGGS